MSQPSSGTPVPDAPNGQLRWDEFRRQMPVARHWAYLDHAAVSPLPDPAAAAIVHWAQQAAHDGSLHWPQWDLELDELRRSVADMLHASVTEIALLHSTTEGVNLVAEGFPWQPGDNVVTLADEFPTNQYPWLNQAGRGVETRRVPTDDGRVDLHRLEAACDARTRIVSISWVGYASGWRNDLDAVAEIAHRHGALFFVDAIQGLGVFPLDLRRTPIDFLAADGHKWMLGPEGAAIFFLRHEHLARLHPLGIGWNSVVQSGDFGRIDLVLRNAAQRYEGGSQNMVGFLALRASLGLLNEFGFDAISARVLQLTDPARRRLAERGACIKSPADEGHRSGIVLFEASGQDPHEIRSRCLRQRVALSCRAGYLRISPHAYNNAEDIERMVAAVMG